MAEDFSPSHGPDGGLPGGHLTETTRRFGSYLLMIAGDVGFTSFDDFCELYGLNPTRLWAYLAHRPQFPTRVGAGGGREIGIDMLVLLLLGLHPDEFPAHLRADHRHYCREIMAGAFGLDDESSNPT